MGFPELLDGDNMSSFHLEQIGFTSPKQYYENGSMENASFFQANGS